MSNSELNRYNKMLEAIAPRLGSFGSVTDKEQARYNYTAYMLARTQQMFEYKGLPETLPARMLELYMQVNGFVCVTDVNGELYAFFGGLGGVPDEYYMPTECIVNNPALNFNKTLKINEDCVIIPNDSMYNGLMPMFAKYSELMAESDITFRITSINARIAELISASDDATRAAAEKYLKDIEAGKLGVIGDSAFFDGVRLQSGASENTCRVIDQIEYHQYLKASWFNELGIQAAFNMKREALGSDEVQLNIKALLPLVQDMLQQRQDGVKAINEKYGTDISVDFKGVWKDTEAEATQTDQLTGEPQQDAEPEQEADAEPEQEAETDAEQEAEADNEQD